MEDENAVQLLTLLRDYYRQYGDDTEPPSRLTVDDLAVDLYSSLPPNAAPEGLGILGLSVD